MAMSKRKRAASARYRLSQLMSSWGRKTRKIARLNARLVRLGSSGALKPSLYRKFTKLIDQLAFFRNKENNILSKINAVERHHRLLRQQKKLKRAAPKPIAYKRNGSRSRRKEKNYFWLTILWLLLLAPRPKKNHKKAGLQAG